jgi:hypothetical protein
MWGVRMEELFREFYWLIFPIMGMGIAVFAIWMAFNHKRRTLDLLRIYAEQGKEPPPSLVEALTVDPDERIPRRPRDIHRLHSEFGPYSHNPVVLWSRFVLLAFLAAGFAGVGYWYEKLSFPFYITAFVLAAVAAATLVRALLTPIVTRDRRDDGPH